MFTKRLGISLNKNLSPFDKIQRINPSVTITAVFNVLLRIFLTITTLLLIVLIHLLIYIPHGSNDFLYEVYVRYPMEIVGWLFVKSFNVTNIYLRKDGGNKDKRDEREEHLSISNHGSFLDSIIFVTILRNRAVGKYVPHYAIGFRSAQVVLKCVMVKRDHKKSRRAALQTIQNYISSAKKRKSGDKFHFFIEGATMPTVPPYLSSFTWSLGAFRQNMPIDAYYISYNTSGNHYNCNYINPSNVHDIFFTYFVPKEFKIEYVRRYNPPKILNEECIARWADSVRKDYSDRQSLLVSEYSFFDKFILKAGVNRQNNSLLFKEYVPWCKLKQYYQESSFKDILSFVEYLSCSTDNKQSKFNGIAHIFVSAEWENSAYVRIENKRGNEIISVNVEHIDEHRYINQCEANGKVYIIGRNNKALQIDTIDLVIAYISQKVNNGFGIYFYENKKTLDKDFFIRF